MSLSMKQESQLSGVFHSLPHGILFHPAASFDPSDGRPVVTIISDLDIFPVLHGSYVVIIQMAEFLRQQGFCTVLVKQARTALDGQALPHQPICDRHFDATFHIARPTPKPYATVDVDAIPPSGDCFQKQKKERCIVLYRDKMQLVDLYKWVPVGPYQKE